MHQGTGVHIVSSDSTATMPTYMLVLASRAAGESTHTILKLAIGVLVFSFVLISHQGLGFLNISFEYTLYGIAEALAVASLGSCVQDRGYVLPSIIPLFTGVCVFAGAKLSPPYEMTVSG